MILAYVDSGTSSFSLVHLPELALLFSFSFSLFAYKYYSNILYEIHTSNITNIINFHKLFLTVNKNGLDKKRGLSKSQLCIVVAIDCHKNTYAVICGHGKPSASRIFEALKNHIASGSTLVHDGERAHDKLIKELDLKEEFYKANTHDKEYLENMALINNMCSWLKRYIYRFIGMRMTNLQSYLNWFVYLFRVKGAVELWPKMDRILRHLILFNGTYKRNT